MIAYKLKLPNHIKLHPVFYVSLLKPFLEDPDDSPKRPFSRASSGIRSSYDRRVHCILDHRTRDFDHTCPFAEFLVHWEGTSKAEATWEREVDLWQFEP